MCRSAFKSANLLTVALVTAAAMLAICLLALGETSNMAEATSLPENGKIAFVSTREGYYSIFKMRADGTAVTQLTNNTEGGGSPVWSPDGSKIAFARSVPADEDKYPTTKTFVMNADGSNQVQLHTGTKRGEFPSDWSPDGSKIAFTRRVPADEGLFKIFLMDVDCSNEVQLRTDDPSGAGEWPVWSPDGSKIAFVSTNYHIYTVNVDGTGLTQLTESGDLRIRSSPDWSPNGSKILFASSDTELGDKYDVFVMNADGSEVQNLTNRPKSHDIRPTWSPDGKEIAFVRDQDGVNYGHADSEIWRMRADGSSPTQVTRNTAEDTSPVWQPLHGPTVPKDVDGCETVHPPDTGGPSLLLVASALLFSGGVLFYAVVQRRI